MDKALKVGSYERKIRYIQFNDKVYVDRNELLNYIDSLKNMFGSSNKGVEDILTVVSCYVNLMDKENKWDDDDSQYSDREYKTLYRQGKFSGRKND